MFHLSNADLPHGRIHIRTGFDLTIAGGVDVQTLVGLFSTE